MADPSPPAAPALHAVADRRTVRAAQRGDIEAREELARACQRTAYHFALHLTGSAEDALDVAQDAMIRVFRSLDRFDIRRPIRPWLLRIVRNLVRDRARRLRVRRLETLAPDPDALRADSPDPGPNPEQRASMAQLQRMLWLAVARLPNRYREVVALRDYMDLSYAEIAAVLKIPAGTVMSRLHRGRALLREQLRSETNGEAGHD
jgi:RNA polymerase sigma-70 factor (ECF subfamily)